MADESSGVTLTPPRTPVRTHERRRPASPAETARRKAWGREWGAVGHEWKVAHPDERTQ